MPTFTTAAGRPILVRHGDLSVLPDPDPRTCSYTHLDGTVEQLGPTGRYNCWGLTFLPRRWWITRSEDVDAIIEDNCVPATWPLRPGDIIRYRDDLEIPPYPLVTTHTGRIWSVDAQGNADKVRSKWGQMGEYLHHYDDAPYSYGRHYDYFRQVAPLRGVSDLWIRDSETDDGNTSHEAGAAGASPDLLVDGVAADPFGRANVTLTAVIRNRGDLQVDGAYIRWFWADLAALGDPALWNAIPSVAGAPNPAGPFSVPAGGQAVSPLVKWTAPAAGTSVALVAITYVNDDPRDVENPDPLAYPFDVLWDNNIAMRVVTARARPCRLARDLTPICKLTGRDFVLPCRIARDLVRPCGVAKDLLAGCAIRDAVLPCRRDVAQPELPGGGPIERVLGAFEAARAAYLQELRALQETDATPQAVAEALEALAARFAADAAEALEVANELRGGQGHFQRITR